ncbi:outer membrane lipoprotein carrier protein LolA [Halorhodospira halochloris]|uniref:outer membrane lipoprotein carrier protein LolA n=1 Tax=Halorhodospira halochloris TaxID=1052 RepID=UPI001EE823E0|nr:outer membrane lipoprotein carrier protein LolA [Halorhodospira halochloris]MCG5529940.1 outer membrane lipoprotein carrier protein LolA [Halorhodospira halochloris]
MALALIHPGPVKAISEFNSTELLQLLNENRPEKISFVEHRDVGMLREQVRAEGKIVFNPPDTVVREIISPYSQRMIFAGESVTIIENGKVQHQMHRDDSPVLSALARFMGVLYAGNKVDEVKDYFKLSLDGDWQDWELKLQPKSRQARRHVKRVSLFGTRGRLERSELIEGNGDTRVTEYHREGGD